MKAFSLVWGLVAFSILGFRFLPKAETFVLQDFESNFEIVSYPEEFLPAWSANEVRSGTSRVFQAPGEGIDGSQALGIQTIGSFDAQIYIKTSTIGLKNNNISFQAKTKRNGTGNRPVHLTYAFHDALSDQRSDPMPIGQPNSFPNEDTPYQEYNFEIPNEWLGLASVTIQLTVYYGDGSGSAARLFMDNFLIPAGSTVEEESDNPVPLTLVEIQLADDNVLILRFNQKLAALPREVTLSGGYGQTVKMELEDSLLTAWFDDVLYPNRYVLALEELRSEENGELISLEHVFDLAAPVPFGSLIINEFMADPNPKSLSPPHPTLPTSSNDEYIELWNTTEKAIWLKGFTYNGGAVEDLLVEAGEYVLLTPSTRKELFSSYGKVAGVNGFRALPNGAGQISLKGSFDEWVDSLSYDLTWYQDTQKSQGGWSLERINPYLSCSDAANWKASSSVMGGTPGKKNAVYSDLPDERPFLITSVQVLSPLKLRVTFSKRLPTKLAKAKMGTVGNRIFVLDSLGVDFLIGHLSSPLIDGQSYSLELKGFTECNGQELNPASAAFLYDTSPPHIRCITGISSHRFMVHFNKPLDTSPLELSQYQLTHNEIENGTMENDSIIGVSVKEPLAVGQTYTLTAYAIIDGMGNLSDSTSFTWVWEDHMDTAFWVSPTVLGVKFTKEVDDLSAKEVSHYWLDRNIGKPFKVVWVQELNEFHLFFTQQFPPNTDLTLYTSGIRDKEGALLQTLSKSFVWDTRAISVTNIDLAQPGRLILEFNKSLERKWATLPAHYQVNQGVGSPTMVEMVANTRLILQFSEPWVEGISYRISIRNLKDRYGQAMNRTVNLDFEWDTLAPTIDTMQLLSPYLMKLQLSKPIVYPQAISVNGVPKPFRGSGLDWIVESEKPWETGSLTLQVQGAKDKSSTPLDTLTFTLDNDFPMLGEVRIWGEREIQLIFTQYLNQESVPLQDNFEVNGRKPHSVLAGSLGYDYRLYLSQPILLNEWYHLGISNLESENGNKTNIINVSYYYEDGIQDLWVENSKTIHLFHRLPLQIAAPLKGDFSWQEGDFQIHPLLNQSDPIHFKLIMDRALPEGEELLLIVPPRISATGDWLAGSSRLLLWDPNPPQLLQVEVVSKREFLLYFDKSLSPVYSIVPSFYTLEGFTPEEAILSENGDQVLLVFEKEFKEGHTLTLEVSDIEDLRGNAIAPTVFEFDFKPPKGPLFRQLVINEIMPAPKAGQVLPNAEYVEIYNATEDILFLGGIKLANSRSYTHLPRKQILPKQHLILCPAGQVQAFEPYGEVLGLSPWPTLLNAGDRVSLIHVSAGVIDEITYDTGSFGGAEFAQGGFSLETVNPYYPCISPANLQVSVATERGTPGAENSVFDPSPDVEPPILLGANLLGPKHISLHFSKSVFPEEQARVQIDPFGMVSSLEWDSLDRESISVHLESDLEENRNYTITAMNFRDCSGNSLDVNDATVSLILPGLPEEGDMIINEVLFNPKVGTPKFVELHNASGKWINLKNWKLANVVNEQISNKRLISNEDLILAPNAFLALTPDPVLLNDTYPRGKLEGMKALTLPSYPISRGSVVLLDPDELFVERFDYDEKMHHGFLREVRGVSLERYSASVPVDDPVNWHSASSALGFATPGMRNSNVYENNPLEMGIQISPEVFVPDATGEKPFTTISYNLDHPGYLATLRVYGVTGTLIRELCHNALWGLEGFYTWDGTDAKGIRVPSGYYILWAELFNPDGQVHQLKKPVVVGSKLR
ncbi:lamin tail domain-containing protein [Pleomorphovibrio marinus]|uniref:lamin tail domain-containing protein n=1 Tax=Pleomorphovibrio marinus TaxID=2164132 RepID=UPI000E0C1B1F|nr:lamin tail domain-containing protein [Pleomorphovibrio marinus]